MNRMLCSQAFGALLICSLLQACSRSESRRGSGGLSATEPDSVATDHRSCRIPAHSTETALGIAARCAELFLVHNGYTDLAPSSDSTQWMPEFLDSPPWSRIMGERHNRLQRHAAVVCKDLGLGPIYLVGFRRGPAARKLDGDWSVMMDTAYQAMKLSHQPVDVDRLLRERDCSPVPTAPAR
jgi:hypothetical protein